MSNDQLRSAAADVVGAFESLSKTSDAAGLMVSSSRCEAAMLKLSAALKDGHGVGIPAAPQPPAKAACDCGDVYQSGTLGADEISKTGRCPGCNAEADAKSDHLVDANKMIADAVAAERERWQHVARAAQEVTTGGEDKIDAFEVPSHLIAALALALDEAPAKAAPVAQPQQEQAAKAWAEGYRAGIDDERTSEDNIGIAGFGAKVQPARNNPYRANAAPVAQPLTDAQRQVVFLRAEADLEENGNLSWRHAIVTEVERAHGIGPPAAGEGGEA
jgi:hypothetical protein